MQQNSAASVLAPPRAGVSQTTTAPWTLDEDVSRYAASGWTAIGVWLTKLERPIMNEFWFPEAEIEATVADAAAETIRGSGLTVSHLAFTGRYTEAAADVRARRVDHTLVAIDVARRLDAACVVIVPGRLNGLTRRRATDVAAASLDEALERSEESDVRLALEPVQEVDFVTTLDEALDLVELVDSPRLGVFPDSFHLWRDPTSVDAIARAGRRIFGVHLADTAIGEAGATRVPPGDGIAPLAEFVGAVEAAGYTGTYDVELFTIGASSPQAAAVLERCAAGLSGLLPAARAA